MAKEWILNSVMNRFQLNYTRNVGSTSENIRECSPQSQKEWQKFYYKNVRYKQHIDELGEKLYAKIIDNIIPEIESISEEDCKNYIRQLVIDRTYAGYEREIEAIYEILQKDIPANNIEQAPDEWDRKYNVDYYILVGKKYIGLQVKPVKTGFQLPQIFKEYRIQADSHVAFTEKYSGKVFYVFSSKENNKPFIVNKKVVAEIKKEIKRLKS